jgi:hypothetical protein
MAELDEDLEALDRDALVAEVKRLRSGIRGHHPALWGLLPERTDPLPVVPSWPQFIRGCVRYRQSLDDELPHAKRSDAEE